MDSAALFPVPVDIFHVLDDETGNPDQYLQKLVNESNDRMNEVARTVYYLKVNTWTYMFYCYIAYINLKDMKFWLTQDCYCMLNRIWKLKLKRQ